jgi:succinoglycan biosynthesis protein ExoM
LGLGADLVVFIDDDDVPKPNWLAQLLRVWSATDADVVFGANRHPPDAPIPRWLAGLHLFQPQSLEAIGTDGLPRGSSSCNVLLSARLLRHFAEQGEVFSTTLRSGEDIDLFTRARSAGFKLAVAPASEVILGWSAERYTFRGVLHRRFDRGMARVHRSLSQGDGRVDLRRQASRRLLRALLKLPVRCREPAEGVAQVIRVGEHLGELLAALGLRTRYYGAGATRHPRA